METITTPAPTVGDHPAMDFINTQATPDGVAAEWLGNGAELLHWLEQAGLIEAETAATFRGAPKLESVAKEARTLRAWLRSFVQRHAGKPLSPGADLGPLNALLAEDRSYARIEGLELQRRQRWESPEELLQPLAAAIADLVCHADFRLIRACEGHDCSLMFLDRTKAHHRRWCSMAVCGNRAKAAAHRARQRSA